MLVSLGSLSALQVSTPWALTTRTSHRFELRPHERTRPLIVGDVLYFANLDGDVFAVHRTGGYVLWKTKIPAGVDGALAYGRAKLLVGDTQGNLIALNSRDGSEAWRKKISSEWLSPPVLQRDRVFISSSSDELFALSEKGQEIWHYSQRGDEKMTIRGNGSPALFGTEVFQGFSNGYLVALSSTDGRELWKKKLRSKDRFYDIDMTPYVDDQSLIVATYDGNVYSLERMTGNTNWVFHVGSYGGFLVEENRIYFAGLNGELFALNRSNGEVIWKTPFQKGVGLTPVRVGEYLVFSTTGDPVYLVNPGDGKVLWSGDLGTGTFAPAAAHSDGWFYCLSNYGNLFSFEIKPYPLAKKGPETVFTPSAIHYHLDEPIRHSTPS